MQKKMWNTPKVELQLATKESETTMIFVEKQIFSTNDSKVSKQKSTNKTKKVNDISVAIKDFSLLVELGYEGSGSFYAQSSKTLYAGLEDTSAESYANAAYNAIQTLKKLNIIQISLNLTLIDKHIQESILRGLLLGDYQYTGFKYKKPDVADSKTTKNIKQAENSISIFLIGVKEELLHNISIICKYVNFVRDIVNTPPNIINSVFLSDLAQSETLAMAKKHKNAEIVATLRGKSYLEEQKMGAFLAVNQASNFPPFLAHLRYKPQKMSKATKKVVIVGKGLIYDTGGLSLKPADYMTTMKADKSGACAVLGIFLATIELGLNIELHAIMGITDNAIGSNAYRPDDVLISREKKSIEVKNTDAEGRLVLVDCLSYAQDLEPDIIIDFATLTGACVVALGEYTSGVMGYNEKLKQQFVESAIKSGELAHTLPFNPYLKKLIESKIADVSNTSSSRYGGAITAGMFLGEFIRDEFKDKWLHVDIAGPAFVEKEWGTNPYGASGAGVLACLEFLQSLEK